MTLKDSTVFGLAAALELTLSVITAVIGTPLVPEFCAGVFGFFLWGFLEAREDEE